MRTLNKNLLILFCLVAAIRSLSAQEDFRATDALTLKLYYEKNWDSLVIVGRQAIKGGTDYYYLRARLGTAYYEKQKYIRAVNQFSKAVQFNSKEPYSLEYLYLSLLYSNRMADAHAVISKMPADLKTVLGIKKKILESAYFETGPTFSSMNLDKASQNLAGQGNLYTVQDRYGNNYYAHLELTLRPAHSADLTIGYSYLDFRKSRDYGTATVVDQLDSVIQVPMGYRYVYSFPRVPATYSFPYNVVQHEIYIRSTVAFPKGYRLIPFLHGIYCRYPDVNPSAYVNMVHDTSFYNTMTQEATTFPFARISYVFPKKDTSFFNFCAGFGLYHDFYVFTAGLTGTYSNLNGTNQYQAGLSLTYYPFANLKFYGTTAVTGFFESSDQRLIVQQMLGFKVFKYMWAEGNFIYGNLANMNLSNGYLVLNNTDKIKYELGANLVFPVSKHVELSLIWQYYSKESTTAYYGFIPAQGKFRLTGRTNVESYNTNTITGGVKWTL